MRVKEVSHRGANVGSASLGTGFLGKVQVYWTVNFRGVVRAKEKGVEVALGKFLEASQSFGVGFRAFKIYALELLFLFFKAQF